MDYDVCIYENLTPGSCIANWGMMSDHRRTWQSSFSAANKEGLEKVGAEFASVIIDDLRLGTCASNGFVFSTGKITVLIGEIRAVGEERWLEPHHYAIARPKTNGSK